jgi:hypothetical protein
VDYFLALATIFVVFVVPVLILVAVIGAPVARGGPRHVGSPERGERTLPDGPSH